MATSSLAIQFGVDLDDPALAEFATARSSYASACLRHGKTSAQAQRAKRRYDSAKLDLDVAHAVHELVQRAPELTEAQLARLVATFRGAEARIAAEAAAS